MIDSELGYMARVLARIEANDPSLYRRIVGPDWQGAVNPPLPSRDSDCGTEIQCPPVAPRQARVIQTATRPRGN